MSIVLDVYEPWHAEPGKFTYNAEEIARSQGVCAEDWLERAQEETLEQGGRVLYAGPVEDRKIGLNR